MKTVKQIVDEYLDRQMKAEFEYVVITKKNGFNSIETKTYKEVSNLTIDGTNIEFYHREADGIHHKFVIGQIIEKSKFLGE
jgi:hypothetical protein